VLDVLHVGLHLSLGLSAIRSAAPRLEPPSTPKNA
jgi:hypothetical protein